MLIRKVAEGIETYESNKNLVLTDGCRADSVPNLEIETGEIAGAGHASTTGRFDDEQLFYLRSRGIDEAEARRLVVHGFFADIIRRIGVPDDRAAAAGRRRGRAGGQRRTAEVTSGADLDDRCVRACALRRRRPGVGHRRSRSTAPSSPSCTAAARFYAIADECSHAAIPLSEGDVGDGEIECYLHGSRFDLRTGEPLGLPGHRAGGGLPLPGATAPTSSSIVDAAPTPSTPSLRPSIQES